MGGLAPQRLSTSMPLQAHTHRGICPLHDHILTGSPGFIPCKRSVASQDPLEVSIHSELRLTLPGDPGFQPPAGPGTGTLNTISHQRVLRFSPLPALGRKGTFKTPNNYPKTRGRRAQLVSCHCLLPVCNERPFPLRPQPTDTLKGHKTQ